MRGRVRGRWFGWRLVCRYPIEGNVLGEVSFDDMMEMEDDLPS